MKPMHAKLRSHLPHNNVKDTKADDGDEAAMLSQVHQLVHLQCLGSLQCIPTEVTLAAQKPLVLPITDRARLKTLPHTMALNVLPIKHLITCGTENLHSCSTKTISAKKIHTAYVSVRRYGQRCVQDEVFFHESKYYVTKALQFQCNCKKFEHTEVQPCEPRQVRLHGSSAKQLHSTYRFIGRNQVR